LDNGPLAGMRGTGWKYFLVWSIQALSCLVCSFAAAMLLTLSSPGEGFFLDFSARLF
jgi:hypothetical protein